MTREELRAILERDVLEAAPALLGAILVRGEMRARIVEVEAYRSDDPASHAYLHRRTARTEVMFGPPGLAYVYFNYGVHWMLNVVCHRQDDPAAILVRAAQPLSGIETMRANRGVAAERQLLSGPGKLAKAFGITGVDNGLDLLSLESSLRLEPVVSAVANVVQGPRVGLAEGKWDDVPWRFIDADAVAWVSRKP